MKKLFGFTLAELLISLLIVMILLVVSAPIVTKKVKSAPKMPPQTPIGAMVLYAGVDLPEGWIECNGQSLERPAFAKLKEVLNSNAAPIMGGVALDGGGGEDMASMMAEMNSLKHQNPDITPEEMIHLISKKYENKGGGAGFARWIMRAQ